jgi:hypothetical protein
MTGQASSQVATTTSAQLNHFVVEFARHVIARVDTDLGERFEHLRVDGGAWIRAGRASLMPAICSAAQ